MVTKHLIDPYKKMLFKTIVHFKYSREIIILTLCYSHVIVPVNIIVYVHLLDILLLISCGLATVFQVSSEAMSQPKVLVPNPTVPQIGIDTLQQKCEVIVLTNTTKANIIDKVKGVDALYWNTHFKLDKEILDAAGDKLKIVGGMSAGYNHIDLQELKSRGIKLSNTPNVLNEAVADVGILLSLAASRRLHEGQIAIKNDAWENTNSQWLLGRDITNSTVGIVGLGGIGQTLVKRMKGFGVKEFLYTGHREKPEGKELGAKFVSRDNLLKDSDFVIVCVPLTNETEKMCNEEFFSKMKKTAVFVNISRGQVVDQEALKKALKNKTIFAAGIDVMTPEPIPRNDELLEIPNLVIMPHLGSATINTRNAMAKLAADNILRALNGEELLTPVKL